VTVPSQPQPHHDDFARTSGAHDQVSAAGAGPAAAPTFVRPPSREIDFARIIKRSDHCRTAIRAAVASIGFAGLALIVFLLTKDPFPLEVAIACTVLALVAAGVRVRLGTAPVPHVQR
jgi:peptidoglycan/LPS O-acetylase OafA/YrhL